MAKRKADDVDVDDMDVEMQEAYGAQFVCPPFPDSSAQDVTEGMTTRPRKCHVCLTTRARTAMAPCSHCRQYACYPQCGISVRSKFICYCCLMPGWATGIEVTRA